MQILTAPSGMTNISAKVPELIGSMFDEELFVEIIDVASTYADGSYFVMTVNGLVVNILMWSGSGRYYFDTLSFSDFTKGVFHVDITAPFVYSFDLFPKKSIGDILSLVPVLLPFWNGTNTFSSIFDEDIFKDISGVTTKVTLPKNTKNVVTGLDKYFAGQAGVYTEEYTGEYMTPSSGYWIDCKEVCTEDIYFEWIDDDGFWRSWYFKKKEIKLTSKATSFDLTKNISALLNERVVKSDQKQNLLSTIFSSGFETKDVLTILNSIKSSSYVFMGALKERVNVKSEDTTDFKDIDEFIFTVTNETKTAI